MIQKKKRIKEEIQKFKNKFQKELGLVLIKSRRQAFKESYIERKI
jgi:hypothetical protein